MDTRGVEARGDSIRIIWWHKNERFRQTLKLKPTKKNLIYATQLRAEILRKLTLGQFVLEEYFPAAEGVPSITTFSDIADAWLDGQSHLALSTITEYRAMVDRYWRPAFEDMDVTKITPTKVMEAVASIKWSMKTRNNALGPLKNIFELAVVEGLIPTNPATTVKNAKVQKPEPDPLTREEVAALLTWMDREPQWRNYFQFAFYSGLRTSELIALTWGDVDFFNKSVRVNKAKVRKQVKETKTNTVRDVELSSLAMAALEAQKPFTFMRSEEIFLHPMTGRSIVDDRPPRLFWNSALKACGMRQRDAYQTRHTCITLWLMAGLNAMWVARQAGHSTPQMTFSRYGRWIARADAGREMAKFEQTIADAGSIPKMGIEPKE